MARLPIELRLFFLSYGANILRKDIAYLKPFWNGLHKQGRTEGMRKPWSICLQPSFQLRTSVSVFYPQMKMVSSCTHSTDETVQVWVGDFSSYFRNSGGTADKTPGLVHQHVISSWTNIPYSLVRHLAFHEHSMIWYTSLPLEQGGGASTRFLITDGILLMFRGRKENLAQLQEMEAKENQSYLSHSGCCDVCFLLIRLCLGLLKSNETKSVTWNFNLHFKVLYWYIFLTTQKKFVFSTNIIVLQISGSSKLVLDNVKFFHFIQHGYCVSQNINQS